MATLFLNYDPFEGGFEIKVGDDNAINHIYTSYGSLLYGFGDDVIRSGAYTLQANHVRFESMQVVQTANMFTMWFCLDDELPRRHWLCTPKNGAVLYLAIRHIQNTFTGRVCKVVGGFSIAVPEKYHRDIPIDQLLVTYVERPGDNEHLWT